MRSYLRNRRAPLDAKALELVAALAEWTEDDQLTLHARDVESQTQNAFAQAHGLSPPAIKSRLLPARQ